MSYYTDIGRYWKEASRHIHKTKLLIEGDSWFSIPDIANIPVQLDSMLDLSILCLANPGDTLEDLSSGSQFKRIESLIKNSRYGQKWDAVMLSCGGNDVIGPEIKKLLRTPSDESSLNPIDYINISSVDEVTKLIKKRLILIKRLRDRSTINSKTPIFVHTYCYLTPRNVAHEIFAWKVAGPWIYPHMIDRNIINCKLQQGIVSILLDKFYDILNEIQNEPGSNFYVIDIRQSLKPVACASRDTESEYWDDEIHPSSKGFSRITKNFFVPALKKASVI